MIALESFVHTLYNVPQLIHLVGQYGLPLIIYAETGLLIGFFLPGDSLLITAGLFAARGDLDITVLIATLTPAAILGNATGYFIGHRTGQALYQRPDSLLFRREHLRMTHEYYQRHGGKTIVMAQFAPILRTFAPVVAGVGRMDYRTFVRYNVVGGLGWGLGLPVLGYFLGQIDAVKNNIEVAILGIVFLSLLPVIIEFVKHRRNRAH